MSKFAITIGRNIISTTITTAMLTLSLSPFAESKPPPPGYPINEIVMRTVDAASRSIIMRRGYWDADKPKGGFGYDKIYHKHNIKNKNVIKYVVHNPNGGEPEPNRSVRRYYAWAHRVRCRFFVCRVIDRRLVKVLVDFRFDPKAKGQKGVFNGYCIQTGDRCPDWVNTARNIPNTNQQVEGLIMSSGSYQVGSSFNQQKVQDGVITSY